MKAFPPFSRAVGSPIASRESSAAFSLIEVVIALGIVTFCLVSIVGLLPVGLKVVKNSHEESAAANALNQMAAAIRDATNSTNAPGTYGAVGAFGSMTWSLGGAVANYSKSLAMSGQPAPPSDARLVARVELVPPADAMSPGRAMISIAWPASAKWDATSSKWTLSEGSISSGIQFLAGQ